MRVMLRVIPVCVFGACGAPGAGPAAPSPVFAPTEADRAAWTEEAKTNLTNARREAWASIDRVGHPPASIGATPGSLTACCESPGHECPASAWTDAAAWQALGITMDRPFRYQYTFINTPKGVPDARGYATPAGFIVRAIGDLDCDGVYATFESFGNQDENGAWDPRWRPDGKFGGFISRELE